MNTFKKFAIAAGLCTAGLTGAHTALAQTTDGFHTFQTFPVVVDSDSFSQRFTFRNPGSATLTIRPFYFPGGGAQTTRLQCPDFTIATGKDRTFASLRAICPDLAAGSEFGYLYTFAQNATNEPYSAFSRVANPQGNGFSVEAFSEKEFTSAPSSVTGIRRMIATVSNPAYQTNCFFGRAAWGSGVTPGDMTINVKVFDSTGAQIGATTPVLLVRDKLVRLSDIFASVGAPAGDYVDARMSYSGDGNRYGVMAFCTVQDNTSFGADFRIAKQEINQSGEGPSPVAAQSDYVSRKTASFDILTAGGRRLTQTSAIAATSSTHVYYFHHPDYVQCALYDNNGVQATTAYHLEMRMLGNDGTTVIAGGNDSVGWGKIYMSDKGSYNTGADGRYTIEVEDNQDSGGAVGSVRSYSVRCQSGSGSTLGEIIRYQEAVDRF